MRYRFIILVLCSFNSIIGQIDSKKILGNFFSDVIYGKKSENILFEKYFYQNPPQPEIGRKQEDILYYKDTLIKNIRNLFKNKGTKIRIYTLDEAKRENKSNIVYDYYYELQKDYIYVIELQSDSLNKIFYALIIDFNEMNKDLKSNFYKTDKIVSLEPLLVKLNRIIQWR